MALVDSATLRVEGYFEETKLPRIAVDDRVEVRLMGELRVLTGHVTASRRGSLIGSGRTVRICWRTSIRRSTGYGWRSAGAGEAGSGSGGS